MIAAEDAAAAAASAQLRDELSAAAAWSLAAYAGLRDGEDPAPVLAKIRVRLATVSPAARERLLASFRDATALGSAHGMEQLDLPGRFRTPGLRRELREAARTADVEATDRLREARGLLDDVRSQPELQAVLAHAHQAVSTVERTARWGVNSGHSDGVTTVADGAGAGRLWVAERDACVHCTAYAGEIADVGVPFPGGLTFGKKPLSREPVANPPLHPNCRCRIMAWRPEWPLDFADALKREARRSIVRGWSLESESERVRLDAADRLLKMGADLPKTVEEYGRGAVRKKHFPHGRRFPNR